MCILLVQRIKIFRKKMARRKYTTLLDLIPDLPQWEERDEIEYWKSDSVGSGRNCERRQYVGCSDSTTLALTEDTYANKVDGFYHKVVSYPLDTLVGGRIDSIKNVTLKARLKARESVDIQNAIKSSDFNERLIAHREAMEELRNELNDDIAVPRARQRA